MNKQHSNNKNHSDIEFFIETKTKTTQAKEVGDLYD